jgi:hypothetical protein
MEDEISKHTKKIYKVAKDNKRSLTERIKDIFFEILIIVFAVTLSIWFHSWSEKRHEQKEAQEFLIGLKKDLNENIKLIETNRNIIAGLDSNYHYLILIENNGLIETINDSIIGHHLYYAIPVTHLNIGRYDGFKSSGKIETIENDSLKQDILVFYQQTIPNINYGENYINSLQLKILDFQIDKPSGQSKKDFILNEKTGLLFNLAIHNFEVNIDAYNKAIKDAANIIDEIEKEIEK